MNAVRSGNVEALKAALRRDPANVHTKVYAQAFETQTGRTNDQTRTGKDTRGTQLDSGPTASPGRDR